MRWRDLISNISFLAGHAVRQKLLLPVKQRQWRRKTEPFLFTGSRNIRFRLYPGQYIDGVIFTDGIYERRFLEFLFERLGQGGAMLDVGANIGNHALYLSDKFDAVHCFEPNPTTLKLLRDNLALNAATNIHIHPVGLGARPGSLPFHEDKSNLGVSRFVAEPGEDTVALEVLTGDSVVADRKIADVRYIKVDVEGFEPEVLEGLRQTIAGFQPVVTFEYNGAEATSFGQIRQALPGYVIVEPCLEPGNVSDREKMAFYLRDASVPPLRRVDQPAERYYPYLLAVPSARMVEFRTD